MARARSSSVFQRLLDLFPVKCLKEEWPQKKGTKEEITEEIAAEGDSRRIRDFIDKYFNFCKQHVYVYRADSATLPDRIERARLFKKVGGEQPHALYAARVKYTVVLRDPFEETKLDFIWPMRADIIGKHVVVRFVVLEKNIGSYYDRPVVKADRDREEEDFLDALRQEVNLEAVDLNKGVKALWAADFMDAPRTQYKKPTSTASEAMDEARFIKRDNPELYEAAMNMPLYNTLFIVPGSQDKKPIALWIDPTAGTIRFPRYSEDMGDTDDVIRQILQKNR